MNPGLISTEETSPIHDKSVRKPGTAPPRLLRLWRGIFLQPCGRMLVRGRGLSPADADGCKRLPVSGLFAEAGG
jgi:hypothetical protein